MPFKKGQSGNPEGMPPGTKHKATLVREDIARMLLEALQRKNDKASKSGDKNYFDTIKDQPFNDLVKAAMPKESKIDATSGGKVLKALLDKGSKGK